MHPVGVCVGGFYRAPSRQELRAVAERLSARSKLSLETVRFASGLEFPAFEQDYEFVALKHPDEYPLNVGRIASSRGLNIPVSSYEEHFIEEHVPHSTALHSVLRAGAFHVGPLARYALNSERLPPVAREPHGRQASALSNNPSKHPGPAVELVSPAPRRSRIVGEYEPTDRPSSRSSRAR